MGKLVKVLFGALAALVVLAALGILAITVLIDPNSFKPEIEKVARQQGIALTLGGDLGWQFFPDLGIVVEKVAVAPVLEPDASIAAINKAALSVKLLPLISGSVAVNGIVLDGLDASLAVDAEGKGNWEKLTAGREATSAAPAEPAGEQFSLAVHHVVITNSQLAYSDAQSQKSYTLRNFMLEGTDIALNKQPFALKTSGDFSLEDAQKKVSNGHFALSANIALDEAIATVVISQGDMQLDLAGEEGRQSVNGKFDLSAKLPGENQALAVESLVINDGELSSLNAQTQQKLAVAGLQLTVKNLALDGQLFPLQAKGTINVEQPGTQPLGTDFDFAGNISVDEAINTVVFDQARLAALLKGQANQPLDLQWNMTVVLEPFSYNGNVKVAPVNARNALAVIGQTLPETRSATAFSKVGLSANVAGSDNAVKASDLSLVLDASTFTGSVAVTDIARSALVVKLKGDQLNADDYMAPEPAPATPAAGADAASGDEPLIPMELLKTLNMDVDLVIGSLVFNGLPFRDLAAVVSAHDSKMEISRFAGKLYDSPMQLTANIDAGGEQARIGFDAVSKQLPVGRLLKDLGIEEHFSGNSDVAAKGTTTGVSMNQLLGALDASVDLSGQQMQLAEVNVEKAVCEFVSQVQGKPLAAAAAWDNFTRLRDMTTHVVIRNGEANVQNLDAGVEEIALKTRGTYHLLKGDFDFHLTTRLVQAIVDGASCAVTDKKLLNRDIPIRCKGNLDSIGLKTCLPDMSMAEDMAKAMLREETDAAKAKVQSEVDAAKAKAQAEADAAKSRAKEEADKALKKKLGEEGGKAAKDLLKGLIKQ